MGSHPRRGESLLLFCLVFAMLLVGVARPPIFRSILSVARAESRQGVPWRIMRGKSGGWEGTGPWEGGEPTFLQGGCPFLMVEEEVLPRGTGSPGRRPLAGISEVIVPFCGDHIQPWDNWQGMGTDLLESRGMLNLRAGKGFVHSEETCVPNDRDHTKYTHLLRVWVDMGVVNAGKVLPIPFPQLVPASCVPQISSGGHTIRVLLGSYDEFESPCDAYMARVLLLDCYLEAGSAEDVLELPKGMTSAFVYVPKYGGSGLFGKGRVALAEHEIGDLSGDGSVLTVKNVGNTTLHYILGSSVPFDKGLFVVRTRGGGMACASEQEARDILKMCEESKDSFGEVKLELMLPQDGQWKDDPMPPPKKKRESKKHDSEESGDSEQGGEGTGEAEAWSDDSEDVGPALASGQQGKKNKDGVL